MEILPVREDELPEIVALEQSIEGEEGAVMAALKARLRAFPDGFLAAREAGRIVGYIESCRWDLETPEFNPQPDFFANQHHARGRILYIIFVGVASEHRRFGVASALIGALVQLARRLQVRRLQAVARVNLLGLYTKLGFAERRTIPFFLPGLVDEFRLMELDLEPLGS